MRNWLVILLLFCSTCCKAQEMWGISNSNFAGNMGILINPSSIVGAPYRNEINFLAGDFYAENTYIYYPSSLHVIPNALFGTLPEGKLYRNDNSLSSQKGFGHALIIGPSYIANRGDYAWGIHTALRSEVSVLNAPNNLAYAFYGDFNTSDIFGIRNTTGSFSSAQATWFELGGTYGKVYSESNERYIKWGATVNALIGFHGYYLDMRELEYTVIDSNNYVFHKVDGTWAHAFNRNNDNNTFGIRGFGLSSTLGATFIRKRNPSAFDCTFANDRQVKYKYRLGVSLMDIGMIRTTSDAIITDINTSTDRFWLGIDSAQAANIDAVDYLLVNNIGGTVREENFSLWLPLALSVQFDYQFKPNIFGNASLVKRIHFTPNQIARADQLSISGRYERRRYEANLNLNLFEWRQPSLGIGLRYRWLVIGTDRLLQLIGISDVRAFDFFFGFKYQFCTSPFGSRKDDCPAYN
jgi:hypothetical protein